MATTLGVHLSWTGLPGDSAVQWSDVSADVMAIETQRGRDSELDQVQTGTASIQLDNWDGRYTPGRAYGPELLPAHVRNTDDATWWAHGPHAALSINSGKTPPAGYLGSSTVLEIDITSGLAQEDQAYSTSVPVTPGKPYKGSFLMQATSTAAALVSARIAFYNAAGAEITSGVDHDYAYNQYPAVVKMSLPDTYHRMGAGETLTNQSNAVVGVDPMVCYNVTSAPSWDKYGSGTAASFNGTNSVAEPCGVHIAVQSDQASSVELWFKASIAGPILADYQTLYNGTWYNAITAAGVPDLSSGRMWPALYVGGDGYLYCQAQQYASVQVKSPYLVNDGLWHHYVAASGGGVTKYYLDGVLIGSDPLGSAPGRPILGCADFTHHTTLSDGTTSLVSRPASNYFTGQITDFAQYRHMVSAVDVADHYRHGITEARRIPINSNANLGFWFPVSAVATAPTGAVKASLLMRTEQAYASSTLFLYSPSLREISPNYGTILPRRKVRVFSTTGRNLMPPGLNLGYRVNATPAGVDVNEEGAWYADANTNFSASGGVTFYGPATNTAGATLYGPSGNGPAVPWMLLPGHSYTFTCQVKGASFSTNHSSSVCAAYTSVTSDPTAAVSFSGSSNTATLSLAGWSTLTYSFTIPRTYTQPEFRFSIATTETLSSGTTYSWVTAIQNMQLVDTTSGSTVPAYTAGDGTMPVFQGFVDKWESLTEYDDTASVVATCSDPMRIMGDTQLPKPPQAFGFQPDWRVLGSWEMTPNLGNSPVDPNIQLIGAYQNGGNTPYSNMDYSPGFAQAVLPGVFLGNGNLGVSWVTSPAIYLMSFGKLAAQMSIEFWFIPRVSTSDPSGSFNAGDQYLTALGPFISMYSSTSSTVGGGYHYFSCGWTDRNTSTSNVTPGAANDLLNGGHVAIELTTSGGSSPTVVTKVIYNGSVLMTSGAETLTLPSPQFQISGSAPLTVGGVSIGAHNCEVYAPASYAAVGLDWAGRLAAFKSGRVSGNWDPYSNVDGPPAQAVVPWLMGACGLARPSSQLVSGSPSTSAASLVDPPMFTSASGLESLNTMTSQLGGVICMSRYGGVMVQDSAYRSDSVVPFVFSAEGATAPDASLLFLSDIDRTWTEADVTQGDGAAGNPSQGNASFAIANYPAFLRYGSHRQSINVREAARPEHARAVAFLGSYMVPSTRCDSAQFTVINQDLAALVPRVDVGSRVVFTDLPANAPTDQFFAWVESVSVSAKADGGTLVPTVTFALSPDFTHLPIQ